MLLAMYEVEAATARHHEAQRASTSRLVLAMAVALLGFGAYRTDPTESPRLLGLCVMALGGFGALISAKQYERARHHGDRAAIYREEFSALDDLPDFVALNDQAKARRAAREDTTGWLLVRLEEHVSLHMLWIALHLGIAAGGALLCIWV